MVHVVFGTGPAGSTLAELLAGRGERVRCVNRSGRAALPSAVEVAAGDILDPASVRELCRDASVVYHCANVHYARQVELMPRFGANLVEGAARAGAKLVVLDTLYVYGRTGGDPMTEATPLAAHTRKGSMRARLAESYLAAHRAGTVRVTLGRAADFFGPRVLSSPLGDRVFPAALKRKPIELLGFLDLPHSYGYIVDVARGLAEIGRRDEALGSAWLLPVAPAVTQREMAWLIGLQLGRQVRIRRIPKTLVRMLGLFDPFMREFVEMFYQYTAPQVVDSSAFERTFGFGATPLEEALQATLAWYRARSGA
jgi:nucleoside-diphosphate-sugar epimerase